jgi:hypothetical protein
MSGTVRTQAWLGHTLASMSEKAEYWRTRAEKAKAEAEKMRDPECKQIMLDIAEAYEKIADFKRQVRQDNPKATKAVIRA